MGAKVDASAEVSDASDERGAAARSHRTQSWVTDNDLRYQLKLDIWPRRVVLAWAIIILAIYPASGLEREEQSASPPKNAVYVEMRNVDYHFTEHILVHLQTLQGFLIPKPGAIPVFDDKSSFIIRITDAQISISTSAMANVLNDYVFAAKDAPIKKLRLRVEKGLLNIKGVLHQKGDISFEVTANISATPEGKIRLSAKKIKAGVLPVKGLMDLLGLRLGDLINTNKVQGVTTQGNDLILDPSGILPAPHIEGRVRSVRLEGNSIVQWFGEGRPPVLRAAVAGNYMAYRGNQLRFGKLTMNDTDMILIDMDPRDPFDFYLDHYKEQLVAGYTKTTPGFGLRVFMRDFNKLPQAQGKRSAVSGH